MLALGLFLSLLSVVAMLSVPVHLVFRVHVNEAWRASTTFRWMFGLISFSITGDRPRPDHRPKQKRKRESRFPRLAWRVMRQAEFRFRLARFLRQTFSAIRPHNLSLRLRLGFDDPADTGMLWAFLGPMTVLFPDARVDVTPEFAGERLAIDAQGAVRIIPAQLAWVAAAFALSPVTWRTIWKQRVRA